MNSPVAESTGGAGCSHVEMPHNNQPRAEHRAPWGGQVQGHPTRDWGTQPSWPCPLPLALAHVIPVFWGLPFALSSSLSSCHFEAVLHILSDPQLPLCTSCTKVGPSSVPVWLTHQLSLLGWPLAHHSLQQLNNPGLFYHFTLTVPLKVIHHLLNTEATNLFSFSISLDLSMMFALLNSHSSQVTPPVTSKSPVLLSLLSSTCLGWPLDPLPHEGGRLWSLVISSHLTLCRTHWSPWVLKVPATGAPDDGPRDTSFCLPHVLWLMASLLL